MQNEDGKVKEDFHISVSETLFKDIEFSVKLNDLGEANYTTPALTGKLEHLFVSLGGQDRQKFALFAYLNNIKGYVILDEKQLENDIVFAPRIQCKAPESGAFFTFCADKWCFNNDTVTFEFKGTAGSQISIKLRMC